MNSDARKITAAVRSAQSRAFMVLLMFTVLLSVKLMLLEFVLLGALSPMGLALDALFAFTVFVVLDLLFPDMRFRAMLGANLVISAVALGITVFHSYYGLLPTIESLRSMRQATTVGTSILELLDWRLLVYFIDLPFLVGWVIRAQRRGIDACTGARVGGPVCPEHRTPYVYQRRVVYVVALAVAVLLGMNVSQTAESADAQDAVAVAAKRGVGTYLAVSLTNPPASSAAVAGGTATSEFQKQVDRVVRREFGAPLEGFTPGEAKGKNVIVIQVEALQSIAVGASVGGMKVTPNLDKLAREGYYFPNCMSAAGVGTTADVEFVTNTSLYPPPEVGASLGWSDREMTSLPRTLSTRGYESYTFHTNEVGFWNRSQLYPALGFTRYYDRTYFGTDDKMAFNSASDQVLLEKTLPQLKKAAEAQTSFYAQVIMMSSHFPFENVPADRRKLRLESPYDGNIVGNYLTEINYVDEQIGHFISQLKAEGLYDESIIVVYGDHFGLPDPRNDAEAEALRALAGHDYNDADKAMVPLIVRLPGQREGVRIADPVGQVDLTPTLADALDVDTSGMVQFGRTILRTGGGIMAAGGLFGRGAYIDGHILYVPGSTFERGTAFDLRTREQTSLSEADEEAYNDAKELLQMSRDYVASLPLRADFDPDAEITFPRKK